MRAALGGLLLGLLLPLPLRADEAEDKAVAFVERLEGWVKHDEKRPGKSVVRAGLHGIEVSDADLKALAGLKRLPALKLRFF